ncbi:hypothetical protein [Streptomyces sp. DH37]|uniref:hypothetical protein n=1 Tax=Streptomyces sp. DH37 TaxID=3040122 RepID=UPI00244100B2|nr:hypothetical protein [Streptomyces sp. DH37]MDG9702977.1 hypothetical protein [Streptomyces sp. DH37]
MNDRENRNGAGAPAGPPAADTSTVPTTETVPDTSTVPTAETAPEASAAAAPDGLRDAGPRGRSRLRRALVPLLSAALVLGAAGGGLAYTKAVVDGADVSAPTVIWRKPARTPSDGDPAPDPREGRSDGELRGKLLPVSVEFRLGPDISGFGNDTELSGRQAQALMREGGKGLPSKQRRQHREYVEKLRVQGIVMRTYTAHDNRFTAEIQLARMKNEKGVEALGALQSELVDALSVFRDGPEIKGHRNARCFLPPKDGDSELETMFCTAHQDEYLVSFQAAGVKPFPKEAAAELLKDQLDHLVSPGEYV